MQIDRRYALAWILGLGIHVTFALIAYRASPAEGEVVREHLVPIEVVEIEPEVADLVEQTVELPPEPEPEPEPEPIDLTEEALIPTQEDPDADPEAEPVFGLSEESVVEDDGLDPDALAIPVGNTIALPPEEASDSGIVKPLAPVPLHKVTTPPRLIDYTKPEYPDLLRGANLEGTVILDLVIGTTGEVLEAKVFRSDHELFNEAAIEAAMKMRFSPALQNGTPVPVRILQPFEFKLD